MAAKKQKIEKIAIPEDVKAMGLSPQLLGIMSKHGVLPKTNYEVVPRTQTGSLIFDYMLGGGLPQGRVFTMSGDSGQGKSTMMLLSAAGVIANGGNVAWFDQENANDPDWTERLGVDRSRFHVFTPIFGEQMMEFIRDTIRVRKANPDDGYKFIVIDSAAATAMAAEAEGTMFDNHMAVGARQWKRFLKIITGELRNTDMSIGIINQLIANIGDMYGPPKIEPGGSGFTFFPSIRIRTLSPEIKDDIIKFRMKTIKNRHSPRRSAEIIVDVSEGLVISDIVPEITELGFQLGVFTDEKGLRKENKAGGWYFDGKKVGSGSGEPGVQQALYSDIELCDEIEAEIRHVMASVLPNEVADIEKVEDDEDPEVD